MSEHEVACRGPIVCQPWEESERNWGVRPDGYSLHVDMNACATFVGEFLREQRIYHLSCGLLENGVPDVYNRVSGVPYWVMVTIDDMNALTRARGHGRQGVFREGRPPRPLPASAVSMMMMMMN